MDWFSYDRDLRHERVKQYNIGEANFEERFTTFFDKNFATLGKGFSLIMLCMEPKKFKEIVKAMAYWCKKTSELLSMKGLVFCSFSVLRHLNICDL